MWGLGLTRGLTREGLGLVDEFGEFSLIDSVAKFAIHLVSHVEYVSIRL